MLLAAPRNAGIAGCGCPGDFSQVLCHATCRTGRVLGQVGQAAWRKWMPRRQQANVGRNRFVPSFGRLFAEEVRCRAAN